MVLLSLGILAASILFLGYRLWWARWTPPQDDLKATLGGNSTSGPRDPGEMQQADQCIGSDEEESLTPKAAPHSDATLNQIPTFSLGEDDDIPASQNGTAVEPKPTPPASSLPSTARFSTSSSQTASSLMPPPAVRPSALRPLPTTTSSLNPPPSAAALARGPPGRSSLSPSFSSGLAPSTSTLPPTKRASRKVILEPGHSPLDWAHVTRNPPTPEFLRGADVPPQLIKVPPSEIKRRNGRRGTDAWGTYEGKVYNLTPYLKFHPGGVGELMRGAGKVGEAERLFREIHPWVNWDNMLGECLVGILVSEAEVQATDAMEGVD